MGMRQQRRAFGSQLRPPTPAVDQPRVEVRLQSLNRRRQRRLRQIGSLGGGRQRAQLIDQHEVAQLINHQ